MVILLRHCLYAEKNFQVGKRSDFSDPFSPQKGPKTPKLGLAIIRACAEKSSKFLGIVYTQRKNFGLFGLFRHLKFFSAYFYAGCLEAEMRQKNFGPKQLRTFFHETTKTPREVFGSHRGESLSLLLVKVTMTPPLSSQQAITSSPRTAAVAMKTPVETRMAGAHGGDINGGGTNNQQSTKSTETLTMTATTMTMVTKGMALATEAR